MKTMAVTLEVVEGPNATRDEDGWEHYAYTVELRRGDETMRVPWRQGVGITDDPTAAGVLEALLSDAATVENASGFEDWAEELGFDVDSRKAERIFKQAEAQTGELRRLLGDDFASAVFPSEADDYEPTAAIRRLTGDVPG